MHQKESERNVEESTTRGRGGGSTAGGYVTVFGRYRQMELYLPNLCTCRFLWHTYVYLAYMNVHFTLYSCDRGCGYTTHFSLQMYTCWILMHMHSTKQQVVFPGLMNPGGGHSPP